VIGLLRAELLRAWSRRVVRVLAIAVAISIVVSMGIATYNGIRNSSDAQYRQALASCLRGEFTPIKGIPPRYRDLADYCADQVRPEYYTSSQLRWADLPDGLASGTSSMVVLLGVLLGATLAGAEWTAGTMGTLLTWEPRRTRVHLVRLGVAVLVVFVFTIAAQALLVVVFRIAVAIAGTTEGTPSGMVLDLVKIISRVAAVAAVFGVVAHAVATLGRSTVAALGVIFGYLIVVEGFVAGIWTAIQPRLLIRAAEVVISQQPLLGRPIFSTAPNGEVIGVQSQAVLLSVSGAWFELGVWAVVLAGVALLVFRARDVN
jgi:ABC-2 type transport system permease protein